MKTKLKIALAIIFIVSACSPKINYMGSQYAPTNHVDLFFGAKDIKEEYKVMGFMQNEGRELANNFEEIKLALIETAKAKGADAILFGDGYQEVISSSDGLGWGETTKGGDIFGMGSSWNNRVKVFRVKLIKYQ